MSHPERLESDLVDGNGVDNKAMYMHNEDAEKPYSPPSTLPEDINRDPKWEKATIRKVDMRLLIILGLCYAISLIDRTNISIARVTGMQRGLRLDIGERYSIISLLFFVPYIIFELPSNIILQKVGSRYWLSAIVTGFGAVTVGMGFVKTWGQLAVCRVLLGTLEAGFFPACVFLISTWYTRYETQSRMAVFYLTSMVISGISNIAGYGMSLLGGTHGIAAWRWIFIICGSVTLGLGLIAFLLIVDFPDKSTFLTAEQKQWIIQRVDRDRGDAMPDKLTFATFRRDISDWKLWCFAWLFMSATTGAYAFAFFLPVILAGQGYTVALSLTLSAPPYVFAAIYTFTVAILSDKLRLRAPFIALNATVCMTGLFITAYAGPSGARYFGAFLTIAGCQANVPAVITYSQNNVLRHSKRSVTSALTIGFGGIGGIVASTVYRQKDTPRYIPGLWTTIALQMSTIVICGLLSMHFKKKNQAADEGRGVNEGKEGFKYAI